MGGLDLATCLQHYKRQKIQQALVDSAINREVAVKFGEKGFGKRPDTLQYVNDVMSLAQQNATSFHVSEELWINPLQIQTGMKRKEMDNIRIGWDLVLDIDCPYWELAKITTWLLIKSLQEHNIKSISLKFSGNKGFHIGVPFESFPKIFHDTETRFLFPEAPRKIAQYLIDYINDKHILVEDNKITLGNRFKISLKKLQEVTNKELGELTTTYCSQCKHEIEKQKDQKTEFVCSKCSGQIYSDKDYVQCEKCNILMMKMEIRKTKCQCGSDNIEQKFNPLSVIEVDTILIAPRHLYRAPYSLHEKSGLCSVPIVINELLNFDKAEADIKKITKIVQFLDRSKVIHGEALSLIEKSYSHTQIDIKKAQQERYEDKPFDALEHFENAAPIESFPCYINEMLQPLEDGKKRALFVLTNFLGCVGWSYEAIEKLLYEWNDKHPEPMRENTIKSHLIYHRKNLGKVLPPNQDNPMYYSGKHKCQEQSMCRRVKNPVFYVRKRMMNSKKDIKKKENKKEAIKKETTKKELEKVNKEVAKK